MNDDLRAGAPGGGLMKRRARAARFWPGDRWRAVPLKAAVVGRGSEKVGDVAIAWREVTFVSEPLPGRAERIFAFFATPERSRTTSAAPSSAAPSVILVHDLGETAAVASAREWAARGYAALALDLPGRGPGREKSRSEGPELTEAALFKVEPDPTTSYLFHAVGAVVRAGQWLREQPEADRQRVALIGHGWGAVIARLAAVADDRAKALVMLHAAGNLEAGPAGEALRARPAAEQALWRSRFDPTAYDAEDAPPAALFVGATGAKRFPLDSLVTSARAYRGPHALALSLGDEAELDTPTTAAIRAWLDRTLRGATGAVSPRAVRESGDTITVEMASNAPARAVSLYVAEGSGSWSGRTWKEVKATRADDRRFQATLPRDKEKPLYFVRVTDPRGAALAALPPTPATVRGARRSGQ